MITTTTTTPDVTVPSRPTCSDCGADAVQRVSVAYEMGTDTSDTRGTAVGGVFTSQGVAPTVHQVNASTTRSSRLAQRLEPPKTTHLEENTRDLWSAAGWFIACTLYVVFLPRPAPVPFLAFVWLFAAGGAVFALISLVVSIVSRAGAEEKDRTALVRLEVWNRQWICHSCGHVFQWDKRRGSEHDH